MKTTLASCLTALTAFGVWTAAPGRLAAQTNTIPLNVAFVATAQTQNGTNTAGLFTVVKPPSVDVITTAKLLKQLGTDEGTNYPAGSRLVMLQPAGTFAVMKGKTLIADVSNILTLQKTGTNDIFSERYVTKNGEGEPPQTRTDRALVTLSYDATTVGRTLKLSMTGLGALTVTDGTPNKKTHKYVEVWSLRLQNATGEGVDPDGVPFVISGSMSAGGSGQQ